MTVTPAVAARALVARAEREHAAQEEEIRRLLDCVNPVARALRERFGVGRIILFGSLAWGGFHAGSDVDFAVEGLPAERIDEAAADSSAIARRTVEIFRIEDLPEAFRQRVLSEGTAVG